MPVYEYGCPHCTDSSGKPLRFEIKQTDYDKHPVVCPKCKAVSQRVMAAPNNSFGWRLTDRSMNGDVGDPKDEYERDV